jgi:tetratricopeptide (TPR) repeat protein
MPMNDKFEYDAFISYRTELLPDKPVAEMLQTVLETYPVPAALKQNLASPGRFCNRLRVFRDLTDLKANPDLSAAIEEKLKSSRFLIVVCTPNTLLSRYIREEVEKFVRHHGSSRVLAVLAAGSPEESYPPFMLKKRSEVQLADGGVQEITEPVEPLAADIRGGTLKETMKKLKGRGVPLYCQQRFKLLAPILGCGSPNDLIQRHRARVVRQVKYAVALIMLVAMTIAGLIHERNRQASLKQFFEQVSLFKAEEQQVAAEIDGVIPLPETLDLATDPTPRKDRANESRIAEILARANRLSETRALLTERHRKLIGEVPDNVNPIGAQPSQLLLGSANAALMSATSPAELQQSYSLYSKVHDAWELAPEPLLGMGVAAYRGGDYPSAGVLLEQAAVRMSNKRGADDRETAKLVSLAARTFLKLGDSSRAYELLERSLNVMGTEWLNTTLVIADQKYLLGTYDDALWYASRALETTDAEDRLTLFRAAGACALNAEFLGQFQEAEKLNRKCIELAEKLFKNDDPNLSIPINNHASNLLTMKEYGKAEQSLLRSQAILKNAKWEKSPAMATVLSNLSRACCGLHRFKEAHEYSQQAIGLATDYYGREHPDVAIHLRREGEVYEEENKFAEAQQSYAAALAIDKKTLSEHHPYIASDLSRLATVSGLLGRMSESEQLHRKALLAAEAAYGNDSANLSDYLEPLASILQQEHKAEEALQLLKRALKNAEATRGPDHPSVANTLTHLAGFFMRQGDFQRASEVWNRALSIDQRAYGEDNVVVASRHLGLGMALYRLGRWDQAKTHFESALATYDQVLGKGHLESARTLTRLALLVKLKNSEQAETMLRRSLAIYEETYGPEHAALVDVVYNLALVLYDRNKFPEAEATVRRAISLGKATFGTENLEMGTSLNLLGMILEKTKGAVEAENEYRRSIDVIERAGSPSHPGLIEPLNNLVILLYERERHKEVVPLCTRAIEIVKKSPVDHESPIFKQLITQLEEILGKTKAKLEAGKGDDLTET